MEVQVSTHNMVNILLVYAFNNILWDFFPVTKFMFVLNQIFAIYSMHTTKA